MTEYLSYTFVDDQAFIGTFDEAPLWSASFGLLLLKHLKLQAGVTVLDIGSGTGFPLLELAGRLGQSCTLYGLDPWMNANRRARQKVINYGLKNVEILDGSAEQIPLEGHSIDLIVSNLGINNFDNPGLVFQECFRVLKPGGKLALTSNLNGHWKEFYTVFEATLQALGKDEVLEKLRRQQEHRGSVENIKQLFEDNGFSVSRCVEESFDMKFLDGSAFLNHYFVKLGWLSSWRDLLPEADWQKTFSLLEANLNKSANQTGNLLLTVPMVYIEGEKMQNNP